MSTSASVVEKSPKVKNNLKRSSKSLKSISIGSPATPKNKHDLTSYKIELLDGDQKSLEISISKNDAGHVLFNKVCDELGGIFERDYFGLRYIDKNGQKQWLDLSRNVQKQLIGAHSTALSFRVKHYPGNPIEDLHQEISQYLLYLQVRRDLLQGRLLCPPDELCAMRALILQSEYGDAPSEDLNDLNESLSAEEEYRTYFKNFNQTKEIESEIMNQHKAYRGLTARDAEVEMIKRASKLPTYGVDSLPVKLLTKEKSIKKAHKSTNARTAIAGDENGSSSTAGYHKDDRSNEAAQASPSGSLRLGLRHTGLATYVGDQLNENFEWGIIDRLACDGKDFIVYLKPTKSAKTRTVAFRCDTKAAALALWKWTVDRQSFFTLKQASEAKVTKTTHSFFRRSHSYRFIGKSQMELKSIADSGDSLPQPSFVRVSSLRRQRGQDNFDSLAVRATLPVRIRPNESGSYPMSDAAKRPAISMPIEPAVASSADDRACSVMNIANDLRAAPGSEANTPIKSGEMPVESLAPTTETLVTAAAPCSIDSNGTATKSCHCTNHIKPKTRDSECRGATNDIGNATDSIQGTNDHQKLTFLNGEAAPHESSFTTADSDSCSSRTLVYAMEVAAFLGIVCFGVIIAALETRPVTSGPGRQTGLWADLVVQLQSQPLVISFNEYIYAPLRGFFIGGGR